MTPSITETQIFTALREFILSVVADCEVIRLPNNRTAMPKGAFVAMSPGSNAALSTNVTTYDGENNQRDILRASQFSAQIDCYGAGSSEMATAISMLLRDQYACDKFAESGLDMQPLYAGEPHQMPLVDGEAKYEERWTFEAVLQINPKLTVSQDYADSLEIKLVNVNLAYPPT